MNLIPLRIQLPPLDPVLQRQNAYYVSPIGDPVEKGPIQTTTSVQETPEWPTGDESFYDRHTTAYTWDDVVFTLAEIRRAALNQRLYNQQHA